MCKEICQWNYTLITPIPQLAVNSNYPNSRFIDQFATQVLGLINWAYCGMKNSLRESNITLKFNTCTRQILKSYWISCLYHSLKKGCSHIPGPRVLSAHKHYYIWLIMFHQLPKWISEKSFIMVCYAADEK